MSDDDKAMRLAFYRFDLDDSGTISCSEIQSVMETLTKLNSKEAKKVAEALMKKCGKTKDDEIGYEEFKKVIGTIYKFK